MNIRQQRAETIRKWHRQLTDDFHATLPLILDELEAIDNQHQPLTLEGTPTPQQTEAFKTQLAEAFKQPRRTRKDPA